MTSAKPPQCGACSLMSRGQGFARGSGTGSSGVLLFGEALGAREAQLSTPFVGDAGAQLTRTLQRVQVGREQFRVDNATRCRPPNNWLEGAPWEGDALNNCSLYTQQELERYKPKVIVPLGNVPMNFLLGVKNIEKMRGYVFDCQLGGWRGYVVPTYHPSFIMRGQQKLTDVHAIDIRRALKVAKEGYNEPADQYIQHPTSADINLFYMDAVAACSSGAWLAADIETPTSGATDEDEYGTILDTDILRISFAFRSHHSISVPWTNANFEYIHNILSLPWPYVVYWNQEFDVPRLQSKGCAVGNVLDAMYMWHFLQSDLPKKLGYVSTFFTELREWKTLSDKFPEYYSCKDADATIQCTYKIRDLLQQQGRLDSFVRHYVELQPHIVSMGNTGVLVDREQQQNFRREVEAELGRIDDEIQDAIPIGVRNKKQRKTVPATATLGEPVRPSDPSWRWDYDRDTGEWIERQTFLYNSPKQVVKYMRHQGHAVPTNYKTGKDTTGAAEIEKLAKEYPDDPLYPRILGAREFRKLRGQYVDGYAPDPDGRVRTHFNRKPSTWRYNSEDPNVQNVIKRSSLAPAYRKQFVAAPGCLLVEADYKAGEAIINGFLAKDPMYIRAAKLGVHSILMAHKLGTPIDLSAPDAYIKGIAHDLKHRDPILYDACKHCVHMSAYGARARRIRIEFPDYFATVREAQELQDLYFSTIARGVKRWQQQTLNTAFQQHYLENPFGYRHYFWDVFHYVGNQLEWGTDAKRALAFLPQSTLAGVISEAIRKIAQIPYIFRMLRWVIHDSLLVEIPVDKYFDDNVQLIKSCMEAPLPELDGLSIEVEIQVGKNWGSMHDYNIGDCNAADTNLIPGGLALTTDRTGTDR